MKRRFKQVDVFTSRPFLGNPVAVVLDAAGLGDADMQAIARWTNLSETTFVLPPAKGGDYRLRIFTPASELPFAGHPTLGSAHAALEAGVIPAGKREFVQECGAGSLRLSVEQAGPERLIFVEAPPASLRPAEDVHLDEVAAALGIPDVPGVRPLIVNVGPAWLVIDLGDGELVSSLVPRMSALASVSKAMHITGVTVFGRQSGIDARLRVRSFAPAEGVPEDPVCGSGNVSVAAYLRETGQLGPVGALYTASQGREVGRDGRVHLRVDERGTRIALGGAAITCIDGSIDT
ncbi:MAG: PhzF family phenazine biosynthesis protein [Burkholderiales bacterium]|jgi:PhzF family phenazine biosynthesis protein|nr:PhzF family phenazine biosynthesis protein [Burkholderiales bacterium]